MAKRDPSLPLAGRQEEYALERSCGIPPAEACRRARGRVENGHATKWERSARVQARVRYLRSIGLTDEMIEAKRQRIEARLELAAHADLTDVAPIDPATRKPVVDWEKLKEMGLGPIISEFRFDPDTGHLIGFKRDDALNALAQLRDMHGFKSINKTEMVFRNSNQMTDDELARIAAGGGESAPATPVDP